MKLTELPKKDLTRQPTEIQDELMVEAMDVSDEQLAMIAGVTKADATYQEKIDDLKRMKKYNPRLYNKIVNFD